MKQILVVDDEPEVLLWLELILKRNGYQPLLARDGAEALALLGARRVDLILSDVSMPRMNGYQLCQAVKTSPDLNQALLPFILFSACCRGSDIRYGKSVGADDFLVQPFDVEDLLAVLKGKLWAADRWRAVFRQPLPPAEPDRGITLTIYGRQLRLDPERQQAWLDGEPVPLTTKETRLLEYLARRPGWVVSDVELVKATHGLTRVDKQRARRKSVRAIVSYLRRKLAVHLEGVECIKTVRGRGYMLCLNNENTHDDKEPILEPQTSRATGTANE